MIIHLMGNDFYDTSIQVAFERNPVSMQIVNKTVVTKKAKRGRSSKVVQAWRKEVLKRDKYACRLCGSLDNLHVHHHVPFSTIDMSAHNFIFNGVTLCATCHAKQHPELTEAFRQNFSNYTTQRKLKRKSKKRELLSEAA